MVGGRRSWREAESRSRRSEDGQHTGPLLSRREAVRERSRASRKARASELGQRPGLALLWNCVVAQRSNEEGDGSARDYDSVDSGFNAGALRVGLRLRK